MTTATALERGREHFGRQAWADAYASLTAADREVPLEPEDLERLAEAAYMLAKDSEADDLLARAHNEFLRSGDTASAARCAFWVGFSLMASGEMARGGGWLSRARRLIDDNNLDCVECGYLLVPEGLQSMEQGDPSTALALFTQAGEIGRRFGDTDLMTLSRLGRGQSLIRMGRADEGTALLDEAMVAVTAGEVSPLVRGLIYCATISACQEELFDLRRAHEWTTALTRWCESNRDMVQFRGECAVHRVEIMQIRGDWPDAMTAALEACEKFIQPGNSTMGAAYYQRAELHRLRGEFALAEEVYREASKWGRSPQPGLALLRLAQGQLESAAAAIRRVMDEARDRGTRARMLAACVEIMLAANDVPAARAAADELSQIASDLRAPLLSAMSAQATGAVLLAESDARAALESLRRAWMAWRELEAPYEGARVRALIGLACRKLGDSDSAEMELDAARWAFRQLGAEPDLARVEELSRTATPSAAGGLTSREVEVLRLIAAGRTNRAIAVELFISEKTVARHVSNIFTKLGLSSRSAATAYAYEHELV